MDNFSLKNKYGARSVKIGKRSKPDKRWTILFIGKHGKTIAVDRFKGMVLFTCLVLFISLATAAGLLYFSLNIRQENQQLRSNFQELKAQIKAIRYEKDLLMTQLVLAESQSRTGPAAITPKPVESASSQKDVIGFKESKQPDRPEKIPENLALEKKDEPAAAVARAESGSSVAVEDFKIFPKVDEKLLRVQFKIKNTSPNSQRVAGHAIVVLKGEQRQQNKWLAMPRITLSDGKPTGKQRGYTFGINYFKTMRFKSRLPKSPEIYQKATVFIFSGAGDLLLEQEFPVNLSAPSASSQTSSSSSSAPALDD
ncbi:hypothetical protein JY97_00855 [Alkalispirochaeta odontotermitis]|nr:hypothetical protein JY97_00855 [Alkalispirochaeta odontotermitis]CAB1079183.1 hypothetical protein D1AOALGA4SA_6898 [Olavius algarvensis Delta 1 endosymbiont]